jgi:tetratricopeptide (TPR) repeat protein
LLVFYKKVRRLKMKHSPSPRFKKVYFLTFAVLIITLAQGIFAQQKFFAPAEPPKSHYKIEARIDLARVLVEGKETVTFKNSSSLPISVLAFDWAIKEGRSIELEMDGKPLALMNSAKNPPLSSPLLFELPKPLAPRATAKVDIKFSAADLMPAQQDEIKLIDWFPRIWWDGLPTHDSFEVKVDIPAGYSLAASGLFDKKSGYFQNKGVKTFGLYLGKGLKTEGKEVEGVLITSLFTEKGSECARLCLETAVDVVKFYKNWLGFYPFEFLSIVPGAAAPMGGYPFASGIVVIHGQERFDKRPLTFWKWITAHEIGHQYWGEYVMDDETPDWLWIGMGIYADREYMLFKNLGLEMHSGLMSRYLNGLRNHHDTTADIPPAQLRKTKFDFNNIVIHGKGFSIISALASLLGKETFERIYKRCLKDYGARRLDYKEFREVCEEMSGQSLGWFFEQWVRADKYLCYQVASQESIQEGDKYVSMVKVKSVGTMEMPVEVKAVFEDGTSQTRFTERLLKINNLSFESKSKLKEVVLDPDKRLAMVEAPVPLLPEELAEAILQIPWSGGGEAALDSYQKAINLNIRDASLWFRLGLLLVDGGYYKESFAAFQKAIELNPPEINHFSALVWMGHLKDLEGSREEALKYYNEALKHDTGSTMRHDQWGLQINKAWVEERLKTPFKWGKR